MFTVIMCGGSGTRFWPVSRKTRPKQFLNITGRGPMVVDTCERLKSLVQDEKMILVLGKEHLQEAGDLFEGRAVHMLAEPVGRNTAPCIGLGAIYAEYLGCKDAVSFLPADHFIADPDAFVEALRAAGSIATSGGIVTLGIVPDRPETGYGYIRRDQTKSDSGIANAYRVSEFVEKPDLETASEYLASGQYYWNAGIFVATAETILKEIEIHLPKLYSGLQRIRKAMDTGQYETELKAVYEEIDGVSFDYGIMEKTKAKIYVLPCECGWSDVGSWSSLYELKGQDHDGDGNLTDGKAVLIDCNRSFVSGNGRRLVACLGLDSCLVVDTPEALLVADLDRSQDIRKIVDHLKKSGKEKLL